MVLALAEAVSLVHLINVKSKQSYRHAYPCRHHT